MNINTEEVIAIGDNINDKKMIEKAGLGIAMGQSHPEVKKVAKQITTSNLEDGVASALREIARTKKQAILQKYYKNIKFVLQI